MSMGFFFPRTNILRTMGNQKLGWMPVAIFRRNMDDSPMVVVWPSCGADGEYNSVALSQRKMPYEVMPTPDPHPPFALAHRYLCHLGEPPHSVHAERRRHRTGCRTSLGQFSRTPRSADSDAPISTSTHHKIGRSVPNFGAHPHQEKPTSIIWHYL
ncbi:hypothetical protein EDB85DRAFT_1894184 [Lactarius pseudohatsudake]|nr:hypothetical protein EDB85DRAFT_1894184 [Lactarius pseudohatsudake]